MAGDIQHCIELAVLTDLQEYLIKTNPTDAQYTNIEIDNFIDQRFDADNKDGGNA